MNGCRTASSRTSTIFVLAGSYVPTAMAARDYGATSFGGRGTPPSTPIPPPRIAGEVVVETSSKHSSSSKSWSSSRESSLGAPPESVAFERSHPPVISQETDTGKLIDQPEESWFGVRSPTLILENSGSVARDHLASERTFLAYMRTSLTIASTGVGMFCVFQSCFGSNLSDRN